MTEWVSCKFFRLNFPYGKKQKPVERVYFRRKKTKPFDYSKFLPKKGDEKKQNVDGKKL